MVWPAIIAAAGTAISASEERKGANTAGGFVAPPSGAPVTVNVGGLNVPAFPNFPRMEYGGAVANQTPFLNQVAANTQVYWVAGALVAVFLFTRLRK